MSDYSDTIFKRIDQRTASDEYQSACKMIVLCEAEMENGCLTAGTAWRGSHAAKGPLFAARVCGIETLVKIDRSFPGPSRRFI